MNVAGKGNSSSQLLSELFDAFGRCLSVLGHEIAPLLKFRFDSIPETVMNHRPDPLEFRLRQVRLSIHDNSRDLWQLLRRTIASFLSFTQKPSSVMISLRNGTSEANRRSDDEKTKSSAYRL